jgi:hypothetical protein
MEGARAKGKQANGSKVREGKESEYNFIFIFQFDFLNTFSIDFQFLLAFG